jgi:hypothetical protein
MNTQRLFLLLLSPSLLAVLPAMGQTAVSTPDFSGSWNHTSLNGLESPLLGPGPVSNRSRLQTGPQAGVSNGAQLVGDYTNPILQPWAAESPPGASRAIRGAFGRGFWRPRN